MGRLAQEQTLIQMTVQVDAREPIKDYLLERGITDLVQIENALFCCLWTARTYEAVRALP